MEEQILRQPQMDKQFELEVDASSYAIGVTFLLDVCPTWTRGVA
jgi:hypothetical protein